MASEARRSAIVVRSGPDDVRVSSVALGAVLEVAFVFVGWAVGLRTPARLRWEQSH